MYQEGTTPWTDHQEEPLLNEFLKLLKKEKSNAKLLDIGCGDGWISIKAAKEGIKTWGIDSSKTAIEKAKRDARKQKVSDKVSFKVGDGLSLPFNDSMFDAMVDRGFFHHIIPSRRDDYFENILRVLKNDALVYLSVFSEKNSLGIGQRFTKKKITDLFSDFKIREFEEDPFPTPAPAHLLHFILERK